jgi:hypothetical protein
VERFEVHPSAAPEDAAGAASQGGTPCPSRYYCYDVPAEVPRQALLEDWRNMGQASKVQERLGENEYLRDHED